MATGGLKGELGVGDPAQAGSDEQSQQFKESFESEIKAIGDHLTYTATNAEAARHDPLAARRDALYPSFQSALGQIDPADPAKAKGAIDKVLADVKALNAEVSKFRQEAEKARNDWTTREPKLETAVQQVEELETWGHAHAPALRGLVDGIRAQVNERKFAQACSVFDQLEPKLKPIYEEYVRQSEAKTTYEPAWEALQPRLQDAQQCEFASMAALEEELGAIATQMTAAADARDYVKAEPMLADLTTKVEQCLTMRGELAEKKAAYDEAYAALQPRIPTTSEPGGERIMALQSEISAGVDEMTAAAAADDYDTATRLAGELDAKITELETALAARQRYDEQMAALQPKLPQATTGAPALTDLESQISSLTQQAETAAAADDYEQACTHLTTLETTLAEYETATVKLAEQQQAYEQARAAVEPQLPTPSEPGEGRLAEIQAQIQKSLADADAAAAAQDYTPALEHVQALEAPLAELKTLLAARDAYETKRAELEPQLPAAGQAAAGRLAEVQTEIERLRSDAEAAANSSDFETALQHLNDAEALLPEYEELAHLREQFDERWADLQPRLPEASEPGASPDVVELSDAIVQTRTTLESKAAGGDYEGALCDADELVRQLSDLEAAKEEALRLRAEFEQEYAALKEVVELAVSTKTEVPAVKEKQDELIARKAEIDAAVSANDYEQASTQITTLETTLAEYETAIAKLAEQQQAYEEARAALEQHQPTTSEPGEGRMAEVQAQIQKSLADADAAAAAQDYETALEHVNALDGPLAELETLLAARDAYETKRSELEPQLSTTGEVAAGRLAEVQTEIERLRSDAEAAANSSDFETALQHLDGVEALLPEHETLSHQREQFDERWADLQPRLPEASEPGASCEVVELNDSIVQTRTSLESKAADGDYEGALCDADELVRLLSDLEVAKEEALRLRAEFEQEYAALKDVVEIAVSTKTEIPAVKEKQDELIARRTEVDAAVTANDYETAQNVLEDLDTALKAYEEELRKEPRNCDWINATATALLSGILTQYLQAQTKINEAADAYDEALLAHQTAINAVDSKKQLVADLAAGIFFAGLGGATGGAVAGAMKNSVEAAFVNAATSGAILDATKDVVKFTTRAIEQFGGSPGDPTAVSGDFGGSGTKLARSVGNAVNDQGVKLCDEVEKLVKLIRDKPEACENGEDLRVEGDPVAALDADPFLKVLGSLAKADQRTFARLLWAEWIQLHAYTIEEQCNLVDPGFSSQMECHEYVQNHVDDLFAWWGGLIKNIETQTGEDFGLRQRLNAAKDRMWKLVSERREAAH